MRVAAASALLAFLAAGTADARMHYPARGHRILPGPAAVLDGFTTPAGAYGFRRLRSAYTSANGAMRIRRASDNLETNIGFDASGNFDTSAATTHCAATSCFIVTWYNQGVLGGISLTPTLASQPSLVFGCQNGQPCADYTSAAIFALSASITPATGVATINVVAGRTAGTGSCTLYRENGSAGQRIITVGAAAQWQAVGGTSGTITAAAPDGAWHSATAVFNGASSSLGIDGASTAGTLTGSTAAGQAGTVGVATTTCRIGEIVLWDNYATTPAEVSALASNQRNYWMPYTLDNFTTPAGAYSFRKLRSAYAGNAVRIRRASDNLEADIGFLGFVPGLGSPVDVAAANAHCAATTCFGAKWYDQSGNGRDLLQATAANQPQLIFNCQSGLPCFETTASAQNLIMAGTVTPATGVVSMNAVARRTSGTGVCTLIRQNGANNRLLTSGTLGTWQLQAGAATIQTTALAAESAFHSMSGIVAGAASSIINLDGTETSNASGGTSVVAGSMGLAGSTATCQWTEGVVWDNYVLTAAERPALASNQRGFWGF